MLRFSPKLFMVDVMEGRKIYILTYSIFGSMVLSVDCFGEFFLGAFIVLFM